jgi:hypothetical protein
LPVALSLYLQKLRSRHQYQGPLQQRNLIETPLISVKVKLTLDLLSVAIRAGLRYMYYLPCWLSSAVENVSDAPVMVMVIFLNGGHPRTALGFNAIDGVGDTSPHLTTLLIG